jgi:hypothetical protein
MKQHSLSRILNPRSLMSMMQRADIPRATVGTFILTAPKVGSMAMNNIRRVGISLVSVCTLAVIASNTVSAQSQQSATPEPAPSTTEWFQKPFLHTAQIPPGFYYLFRSGDMLPTYYIKMPTELEKKRGEVPYIENRAQARKIDAQYKNESNDPHLSFKTLTVKEEAAEATAARDAASGADNGSKSDKNTNSAATVPTRSKHGPGKSPFSKNNYWSTFKGFPKGGMNVLFGPTVAPNSPPFRFEDNDQKKAPAKTATPTSDSANTEAE